MVLLGSDRFRVLLWIWGFVLGFPWPTCWRDCGRDVDFGGRNRAVPLLGTWVGPNVVSQERTKSVESKPSR